MSSDALIAEQLLDRPYKGIPFKGVEYMTIPDSSSAASLYANFQLAENGLATSIVDIEDEGSEVTIVYDLKSSTSTAYTATTQIVPKAAGWLGFFSHCEIAFSGVGNSITEPASSSAFITGPKFAVEETYDYANANAQSLAYALDTSGSLVPSLALGATGAAAYSGVGSSGAVNGGLTIRQAAWNQNAYFNAATSSWRVEVHLPLKFLHDIFRRQGAVYGIPISQLKVWYNTGNVVMPVVVLTGEGAPIITALGAGNSMFRYRRMVPSPEFQRTLMTHLADKADETYKFLSVSNMPSATVTAPTLSNVNLSSCPSIERLWVFLSPSGANSSSTSLYPHYQAIGLNQLMIRCGGEQLSSRQLALQNPLGQYEYSEIFRTVQDACAADPWARQSLGLLNMYNWRIANRYHCFPIREHEQIVGGQNILFQAVVAGDIAGVTPSGSTPVDVVFLAEYARWLKKSYMKQNGVVVPTWTVVD